jgi:hypothetical protein
MKPHLGVFLLIVVMAIQGCAAYPKVNKSVDYKRCDLLSRSYTLTVTDKPVMNPQSNNGGIIGELVVAGVFLGATVVVSGSLVVVGNTVHFLEKQGRCEDSYLNRKIAEHVEPLFEKGGEPIILPDKNDVFERKASFEL